MLRKTGGCQFIALIIYLILSASWCLTPSWAAQQGDTRVADIKASLARLSSNDPIDRMVAAEEALRSSDPVLRSLALETALQSDDRRVREAGLRYLVGVQKTFIISIDTTKAQQNGNMERRRNTGIDQNLKNAELTVNQFDEETGNFLGRFEADFAASVQGQVGQDGIEARFDRGGPCVLHLRTAVSGFLIGSLDCGTISLAARTALP